MTAIPSGRIIFARRRSDESIAGVLDVPRGLRCDCMCPECGARLIARQGALRSYFAHVNDGGQACGPGAWHTTLCRVFGSLTRVDLGAAPMLSRMRGTQRVIRGKHEARVLDDEFRLDALLQLQSGDPVAVEIVDRHEIPGLKLAALQQEGFRVLRIDAQAMRVAMSQLPATSAGLQELAARHGCWQSWPTLDQEPHQVGLLDAAPAGSLASWVELIRSYRWLRNRKRTNLSALRRCSSPVWASLLHRGPTR